jgi:hypothetical protein
MIPSEEMDLPTWFAELDRSGAEPFLAEGRNQPSTPTRDVFESRTSSRLAPASR